MGGDGGSIPTRRCLVPDKKRIHKENPTDKRKSHNNYCQLSAVRLKKPIIASRLGKLYNKEAVIDHLIDSKNKTLKPGEVDKLPEIKSLKKDSYELILADNTNFKREEETAQEETKAFPFICTVTGYEMNGSQRFVFGTESKHVVSEKALKESNAEFFPKSNSFDPTKVLHYIYQEKYEEKLLCPVTNKKFGRVIQLYPETVLEIDRAAAYGPRPKEKKKKKGKRKAEDDDASGIAVKAKYDQKVASSTIKMPSILHMTQSVTADVSEAEIEKYRKLKLIGDTTKSEDKSALGQMFKCSRPWQH